jgi:small conductance mechanosensitive channel
LEHKTVAVVFGSGSFSPMRDVLEEGRDDLSQRVSERGIRSLFCTRSLLATWVAVWVALFASYGFAQDNAEASQEEPAAAQSSESDGDITPEELALRILPLTADQLSTLAEDWLRIVQGLTAAVVAEQLAIREAEGDGGEAVSRERLNALTNQRALGFANFKVVVDSLELKGGDEAQIANYRAFRSAIIVEETQAADWRTLLSKGYDWLTDRDGGIQLAINALIVLAALLGLLFVARIVKGIATRSLRRVPNISKLLLAFLSGLVYWLTLSFGLLVVLGALGVNITPLFALVGGATFILAFAMQDTLSNLAAGVMIIINRPFDEGDYVTVGGVGGTVKAVSIVSTTVVTPDNQIIVIPNSSVWGDVITNVTASETRRVDLVFGIGYDDDIAQAQQVLEDTVKSHPLVLSDPEPVIRVNELADSSVNFIVRPWVRSADYWSVYWDLIQQVKLNFDAAGISIPFPQSDLHVHMPQSMSSSAPKLSASGTGAPVSSDQSDHPKDIAEATAQGEEGFENENEGDRG